MKKLYTFSLFILLSLNTYSAVQGDSFTYQGELLENGQPANGNYDINTNLYTEQTNGSLVNNGIFGSVPVINGIFTIQIDMGDTVFVGDERWLGLEIRQAGGGAYTPLLPRQLITNSPYSIHAQYVGTDGVDSFAIQNASVTTGKIADAAVVTQKLANAAVTIDKLSDDSVSTAKLITASVTTDKINDDAVVSDKIAFGAVNGMKIAGNAVESAHIMNGTIVAIDIANSTITEVQLANDSVTQFEIATGAVKSDEILNGTIVAADIDNTSVQQRVTGTCPSGSSIRSVVANGTVACEVDDYGWGLFGNAGTISGTHFIGTTDNQPLILKTNNKQAIHLEKVTNSLNAEFINLVFGDETNLTSIFAGSRVESVSILGGDNNRMLTTDASSSVLRSVITGGANNTIIDSNNASISGGSSNSISFNGTHSIIVGGINNEIRSDYAFAAGLGSKILHRGGWVWNDASNLAPSNSLVTTDMNQFLIRAEGGFGLGTNAPASPMHIKGQGTSTGSTTGSNEVVMTLEPKKNNNVAVVLNKPDSTKESALIFSTDNQPEFDIRAKNSVGFLDFNHYDNVGTKQTLMQFEYYDQPTNSTIFMNADVWVDSGNSYLLGSNNKRWKHIYTENITTRNSITTDSDKRLKNNIQDLEYGLADILSMRPVSYNLKNGNTEQVHLGFIAQEIKSLIPEIVSETNDEKHMLSMRYSEIIPILIKSTQEQQALIDQQSTQIILLQKMVDSLIKNQNSK